jgi:hypothetical protein
MQLGSTLMAVVGTLGVVALGCSDSRGSGGDENPTLVAVEPDAFLRDVPCLSSPGAMRRYVATLEDVTGNLGGEQADLDSFVLPSSPPVSCVVPVAFGFVVPEHRYVADIQGYDRTNLVPLASGSPVMLSPESGEVVEPRWTTSCGRQDQGTDTAVIAYDRVTIFVRACEPLTDHLEAGTPTGVTVSLADALGDLGCGTDPGAVDRFEVTLNGSDDAPLAASCGDQVTLDGLIAETTYTFTVTAFEANGTTAAWQTTCFRTAEPGAIVPAYCDPLVEVE